MTGNGRVDAALLLITALAGGASVAEAARRAGVSERTAWRRLDDPDFCERVEDVREQAMATAVATLTRAATEVGPRLKEDLDAAAWSEKREAEMATERRGYTVWK
jgi:hypothetical protein